MNCKGCRYHRRKKELSWHPQTYYCIREFLETEDIEDIIINPNGCSEHHKKAAEFDGKEIIAVQVDNVSLIETVKDIIKKSESELWAAALAESDIEEWRLDDDTWIIKFSGTAVKNIGNVVHMISGIGWWPGGAFEVDVMLKEPLPMQMSLF